jgi:hypothetical protein
MYSASILKKLATSICKIVFDYPEEGYTTPLLNVGVSTPAYMAP